LLALLTISVLAVAWLAPAPTRVERVKAFDPRPLRELRSKAPRYVLIGNSMLATRIDGTLLERELGEPVGFLPAYGSASAVWYLMLKNYVAPADLGTCDVAIFFRETVLTRPYLRIGRRKLLESVSHAAEPTLETVLADRGTAWQERARYVLLDWADPTGWRNSFRRAVNHLASEPRSEIALDDPSADPIQRINTLFALDGLRNDGPDDLPDTDPPSQYDFEERVEHSFLPHMLDLADANGFKLWFIHVKRKPRRDGSPREAGPALEGYLDALQSYVEERNAGFIDLRQAPRPTLEMYGRGDHIARAHRGAYTRMFPKLAAAMFRGRKQP
jgi:hypothetical protein